MMSPYDPKPFHPLIFRFIPEEGSLLDVGIERGAIGALCRIYRPRLRLTAMEAWKPYLDFVKHHDFYAEYVEWDFSSGELPSSMLKSRFTVTCMLEVIEHLEKESALRLIKNLKLISESIIVSTPNGWVPQFDPDGNRYQNHRSAWSTGELKALGFKVRGVSDLRLPSVGRFGLGFLLGGIGWLLPAASQRLLGVWKSN